MSDAKKDELCPDCIETPGLKSPSELCPTCGGTPSKNERERLAALETPAPKKATPKKK